MNYDCSRKKSEDTGATLEMSDFPQGAYRSHPVLFFRGISEVVRQLLIRWHTRRQEDRFLDYWIKSNRSVAATVRWGIEICQVSFISLTMLK